MRRMLLSIVVSMTMILFYLALSSIAAQADAREYYKCKLADGVPMEELEKVANDFMKIARMEGFKDYSMELLWPMFSEDISRGTFYWAGIAPNASRIGAINEYWYKSEANADIRKRFGTLTTCESSSMYMVTKIK